jgi:hypothetical protein
LTLNHATNPSIRFEDSGTKVVQINAEGSSTNIGSFEGKALVFATSTGSAFSERMRIDTAGRLLIGHSTGNGFQTLSVSGNTGGSSGAGMLFLRRGLDRATIGTNVGADLGEVDFGDLDGNVYASIQGKTDAATGSNDFPGRIILATTADGGSSPSERMRIDSSGRVAIGTTAPSELLTINGADQSALIRTSNGTGTAKLKFEADGTNYGGVGLENTAIVFRCSNNSSPTERMRIDSNGFLCIGTTDNIIYNHSSGDDTGTVLDGDGGIQVARLNDQCGILNRMGTDGTILSFHNDGTCVGFISVSGATTGYSTNCSDRSLKKNCEDWTEDALSLFKDLKPQKFNFTFEDDSNDKTKGYIAQDLVANFPEAYPKNDEGKYVFNPSGMVVYLMKAIQQLEAKVAALEAA